MLLGERHTVERIVIKRLKFIFPADNDSKHCLDYAKVCGLAGVGRCQGRLVVIPRRSEGSALGPADVGQNPFDILEDLEKDVAIERK